MNKDTNNMWSIIIIYIFLILRIACITSNNVNRNNVNENTDDGT